MAIRIQIRRDTAANWTSANPVLRAGEFGVETDTLKFKIGNGSSTWTQISTYANVTPTGLSNSLGDYILLADQGTPGGPAELNASGDLLVPENSIILWDDNAYTYQTTLSATQPTANRTITLPNATGTVALTSDIAELSQDAIDTALTAGTGITKNYNDSTNTLTIAVDTTAIQAKVTDVSDTEIGYLNGVTSAIQTQLDDKSTASKTETLTNKSISLGSNTVTSTLAQLNTVVSDADLTSLAGSETLTNKTIAFGSNTVSGTLAQFNTAVTDADLATLAGTETLTNKTLTSPAINTPTGITKSDVGLANVDNTTDANKPVSSATQTALDLKSPLASPTFTGTVNAAALTLSGDLTVNGTTTTINSTTLSVDDKNVVLGDVATPSDATADGGGITLKGATDKTFNWVDATDSWTSSEHVNLASGKSLYLNGTLLKDTAETLTNKTINATSNTITVASSNVSDFNEAAQDAIGNAVGTGLSYNDTTGSVSVTTNTYDAYGSASTVAGNLSTHESDTTTHGTTGNIVGTSDTQTLTNKTLTSPVINTPTGITKSDVGLANVDNTTDANKPVSTATQTALDLKAPLASPTLTGTPTAPTAAAATNTTQVATTAFVRGEVTALVNGASAALDTLGELAAALTADEATAATLATLVGTKAPIASPTFTGTVSGVTATHVGLGNVDNTTDANKPVSTATQTALDLKLASATAATTYAPLASPTFTGTVTLPSGTVTSTMIADGTIADADINASAAIALSKLATDPLARANHTGSQTASTISDFNEAAQDAVNTAIVAGTGLDKTYDDSGNTITLDIDSTVATLTGTQTLTNKTLTSPVINTPTGITKTDVGLGNVDNTSDANKPVSSATQTALDLKLASATAATTYETITNVALKAPLASPALTGTPTAPTAAAGNNSTQVATTAYADAAVAALVDAAPGTLNTLNEIAAAINDDASYAATITTALGEKAPLASPTFTGTVSGVTATHVGLGNVDNTTDANKPVSTATQTALNLKLNLTDPAIDYYVTNSGSGAYLVNGVSNGNIYFEKGKKYRIHVSAEGHPFWIQTVSGGYSSGNVYSTGITNNGTEDGQIIVQLPSNAPQLYYACQYHSSMAGSVVTGTTFETYKALSNLSNVDNTTDANKPVSTATQTALDLKAPLASPTFTGTVSGVTKTHVGLGNVDNTTDANKPVSTATQTALDLKAPLASPTFTGTVSGVTATHVGLGNVDNTSDANKPVSSATQTALDLKIDESLFDAKGDLIVGSADNTPAKISAGTNGYVLTANSSATNGIEWAASAGGLPSQTGSSGYYLSTNGSTASWVEIVLPAAGASVVSSTVSSNSITTIDTVALSSFTSAEYLVSLKQGSKIRTSKVIIHNDGTSVDITEFAITETGGIISGVVVSAAASSPNALLKLTATDAATTNVSVKLSKVVL